MPNINLRDARNRDALVRAESVGQTQVVRYVDNSGGAVTLRRVLKGTLDQGLDALVAAHGDLDGVAAALVVGDPEVDIERAGQFLIEPRRVYLNDENRIVYRIVQTEIVRGPDGAERERRPKRRAAANVDGEIPLSWTGRKIKKADALTRFVFHRKLQIVHVNGLTYDFLYGIAKELAEADSLMLLGAGPSGKEPLIISSGSTPCRGFLEGRIDGDRYVLLLHLSRMELKRPAPIVAVVMEAPVATAAQTPPPAVATPAPAPPAKPHKPTVAEVMAATAPQSPVPSAAVEESAKAALGETVAGVKTARRRKTAETVAGSLAPDSATPSTARTAAETPTAKPARKRASRTRPAGDAPAT